MSPGQAARPPHYSAGMRSIHWATAALIVAVVVLAWVFPHGKARDGSIELRLHEAVGLTILALTVLRLVVARLSRAPEEAAGVPWLEAAASRVTHLLLYVILLAMPVSGFLWATSRGTPVDVLGLFAIPPLLPASETLHAAARIIHKGGQYAVYAMVGLHVAAALYHLVVRRDGVMARMLPGAARFIRPQLPAAARPAAR